MPVLLEEPLLHIHTHENNVEDTEHVESGKLACVLLAIYASMLMSGLNKRSKSGIVKSDVDVEM